MLKKILLLLLLLLLIIIIVLSFLANQTVYNKNNQHKYTNARDDK